MAKRGRKSTVPQECREEVLKKLKGRRNISLEEINIICDNVKIKHGNKKFNVYRDCIYKLLEEGKIRKNEPKHYAPNEICLDFNKEKIVTESELKRRFRKYDRELKLHTECQIDSAHRLVGYDGKCQQFHGHTWHLDVYIIGRKSQCDKDGILYDFGKVKEIQEMFCHKLINDVEIDGERFFDDINPTAENMSTLIYLLLKRSKPELKFRVRLYETKVAKETYCTTGDF